MEKQIHSLWALSHDHPRPELWKLWKHPASPWPFHSLPHVAPMTSQPEVMGLKWDSWLCSIRDTILAIRIRKVSIFIWLRYGETKHIRRAGISTSFVIVTLSPHLSVWYIPSQDAPVSHLGPGVGSHHNGQEEVKLYMVAPWKSQTALCTLNSILFVYSPNHSISHQRGWKHARGLF